MISGNFSTPDTSIAMSEVVDSMSEERVFDSTAVSTVVVDSTTEATGAASTAEDEAEFCAIVMTC